MLKKEINFLLGIVIFILSSCNNPTLKNSNSVIFLNSNQYVAEQFKNYEDIYSIINDSINIYSDSMLQEFLHIYGANWQIDSMICINSLSNELVASINISYGLTSNTDGCSKVLGKKINNKWYFFSGGGHLVVPRKMYSKDAMHPLTFHELSQIARKEMLASALIKNDKGEYIVNDKWVDGHFYYHGMCGHCKTQAQYDSTHWYKIIHKWKEKIDTNEYKPLHRHKMNNPAL